MKRETDGRDLPAAQPGPGARRAGTGGPTLAAGVPAPRGPANGHAPAGATAPHGLAARHAPAGAAAQHGLADGHVPGGSAVLHAASAPALRSGSAPAAPAASACFTRLAATLGGPRWLPFLLLLYLAGLVLPVWWLVSTPPPGLPGLADYPSAYLGDSLLLPAGCTVLLAGIRRLRAARGERLVAAAAAVAALVSAVAVQAEWLEDPSTPPNWTMPRTGHFNAAGWWHAVYFTGMSMVLVVLTVLFLARVRAGRRRGDGAVTAVSSGTGAVVLLTAWGSYAVLAVHDDFSGSVGGSSSLSSFTLVGMVLLVAAGLTARAYGRLAGVLSRPALTAIAGIAVISTLTTAPAPGRIALGTALAALGGAAAVSHFRRRRAARPLSGSALAEASLAAGVPRARSGDTAPDGPAQAPTGPAS